MYSDQKKGFFRSNFALPFSCLPSRQNIQRRYFTKNLELDWPASATSSKSVRYVRRLPTLIVRRQRFTSSSDAGRRGDFCRTSSQTREIPFPNVHPPLFFPPLQDHLRDEAGKRLPNSHVLENLLQGMLNLDPQKRLAPDSLFIIIIIILSCC